MNEQEQKIQAAAKALQDALNESSVGYNLLCERIEVTTVGSQVRQFGYVVVVEEAQPRRIAP